MGKNKRSEIVYNGVELDSVEELQFYYWLEEAKNNNLIKDFTYQPKEFVLFEKVSFVKSIKKGKKVVNKEQTLLNPHIYTPDFCITFTDLFYELCEKNSWNKLFKHIDIQSEVICDIKGGFSRNGGDRTFSINQKWVYQKYEKYITKIVPKDLFKLTWCPELAKLTPKKKQIVEKYKDFRSITQILETEGK
jgi:hypothetical protein